MATTKTAGPKLDMRFEEVPISKINVAKYNPRKELQPTDGEYQNIKKSIQAHGLADPLIWNEHNGVLIGGHQRLRILTNEFGVKTVWCSVRSIKDEKEEMSLNSALNKNQGEWDFLKLKAVLFKFADDAPESPFRQAMGFGPLEFKGIMDWSPKLTASDELQQTPSERLDAYNQGAIKQIVLYFDGKSYGKIVERLEGVRERERVDDNTSAFVRLLESYENNHAAKKANPKKALRRNRRR